MTVSRLLMTAVRSWKCSNRRCNEPLGQIVQRELHSSEGKVDADRCVWSDSWADITCKRCGAVTRWWFRPGR